MYKRQLSTCAQLERENIQYRLNSGRKLYIERGGVLGRKKGSCKDVYKRQGEGRFITFVFFFIDKKGDSIENNKIKGYKSTLTNPHL